MADKYEISAVLKLVDNATAPLKKMGEAGTWASKTIHTEFVSAEKQINATCKRVAVFGGAIAAAGAAAAGKWAVDGVKNAVDYSSALAKLSTVADTTKISMSGYSDALIRLSNETGDKVEELTSQTYTAITNGIDSAHAVSFVGTALKAAKAGFTDTSVAIDGITTVLNAYGLAADQADAVAGKMLVTQNYGKTSFADLAQSMGKIVPTASRVGLSTDDLFASLSALTGIGMKTPEAVSGLEAVLKSIEAPTAQVSKLAQELGINYSAAALKSKGFAGFLADIQQKTHGNTEQMKALLGSDKGLNAALAITGRGAKNYAASLAAMADSAGALNSAFAKVDATPAEKWEAATNRMRNAGIKFGGAILPLIEKLADKVSAFADRLSGYDFTPMANQIAALLDSAIKMGSQLMPILTFTASHITGIIRLVSIGTGMTLFTGMVLKLIDIDIKLKTAIPGIKLLTSAKTFSEGAASVRTFMSGLSGIPIIIAAVAAAVVGIIYLMKNWNHISTGVKVAIAIVSAALVALNVVLLLHNKILFANPAVLIVMAVIAAVTVLVVVIRAAVTHIKQVTSFLKILAGVIGAILVYSNPLAVWVLRIMTFAQHLKAIVAAFKAGGIVAGIREIGKALLASVLAPLRLIFVALSKIPKVGGYFKGAVATMDSWTAPAAQAAKTSAARPVAPVTQGERMAYSRSESVSTSRSDMYISVDPKLQARVSGKAKGITVQRARSGQF